MSTTMSVGNNDKDARASLISVSQWKVIVAALNSSSLDCCLVLETRCNQGEPIFLARHPMKEEAKMVKKDNQLLKKLFFFLSLFYF